ncbi:MAG TPA: peptide chain release factor N(5)-glutamine methyltransferase [Amaricoccus sp.]|nr:peptide chain release factor N(5)-glutamine methyltransferase [Amaricoccus sp.]
MSVRAALAAGTARLGEAGVEDPARDARRLMAEALGVASDRLTLLLAEPLPGGAADVFQRMIGERARARPVAQIIGRRAFWGRDFAVTGAVLDPRPETETLVALALGGAAPARILDLGTGSGAILVTLLAEWPEARGVGTDVDPRALEVAARNAGRHGVGERAAFLVADWTDGLEGRFDLVVSNPPYIPAAEVERLAPDVRDWEPRHALTAGPTGLEAYARIAAGLGGLLAPGGRALVEVGAGQGAAVAGLMAEAGFAGARVHPDLDGRDRVVATTA